MPADEVATLKMAELQRRLDRIRAGIRTDAAAFPSEESRMENIAFNVLLAVQTAVDLGAHLIAREGWEPPDTLSATFTILEAHAVLGGATAEAMRSGTRLRNLIAHGYARVDPVKLVASAQAGLDEFARFLAEVAAWEQERP
ncbi:MAG: DUF86 domain-containing protein [Deltaproteobacteria bacterium]|nr:DUF86 domain-containing protein [Deltaproteobacteria bacterium]